MSPTQDPQPKHQHGVLHMRDRKAIPESQESVDVLDCSVLEEEAFRQLITVERRRTERSGKPILLMLLDAGEQSIESGGKILANILSALSLSTRKTDITGWYRQSTVIGVLFTEINLDDQGAILSVILAHVSLALRNNLGLEKFNQISISLHVFPEDWNRENSRSNPALYPDLEHRAKTKRFAFAFKRALDIVGSLLAIVLFAPLFVIVAAAVKFGSKGPILFKQERIGQFGRPFTFLKFRSMHVNNDAKIHQEFMKRVISGEHDGEGDGKKKKVYKMTDDPRVTPLGRILRRTSLDELPQFFNVLQGSMSLVGPRPPLAYECQEYELWHRRRVLEVKPGITGLWQVQGRSRVSFDDMVRLDLQYVRSWSLWLDLWILIKTPFAVCFGSDAF